MPGAATKAQAGSRLRPRPDRLREEELSAILTKVLNSAVHPQSSRPKEPAGRKEDLLTKREAQPQHGLP